MNKIYYIQRNFGWFGKWELVVGKTTGYVDKNNHPVVVYKEVVMRSKSKWFLEDLARVLNNSVRFQDDK